LEVPDFSRPPEGFDGPGTPGYPTVPTTATIEFTEVQEAAASLLGRGYSVTQVARILQPHLVDGGTSDIRKGVQARHKLKRWIKRKSFRDLVYQRAVVELDLNLPGIIKGVAHKARSGRVDAARLALELTGRHDPKGEQHLTHVTVQIANIPRPGANSG
jgi:hypothetical protein